MSIIEQLENLGAEFTPASPVDCTRCENEGPDACPYAPHTVNTYGGWSANYRGVLVRCTPRDYLGENFHHEFSFFCDEPTMANSTDRRSGKPIVLVSSIEGSGFSVRMREGDEAAFINALQEYVAATASASPERILLDARPISQE